MGSSGSAAIPTPAIDPSLTTASPAVPALQGSGSPDQFNLSIQHPGVSADGFDDTAQLERQLRVVTIQEIRDRLVAKQLRDIPSGDHQGQHGVTQTPFDSPVIPIQPFHLPFHPCDVFRRHPLQLLGLVWRATITVAGQRQLG